MVVEKIQANKCPNKTMKDIIDVMRTLKIMMQTFTSKKISSKQIRDMQCIMLCFKRKMLYNKPYT
jgi:hypothetical protein